MEILSENFNFSLRKKFHEDILKEVYDSKFFTDVTLVSGDDHQLQCHKFMLATHSQVLRNILLNTSFTTNCIYLSGAKHNDLKSILDFFYLGEVTIAQEDVERFMSLAKDLKINEFKVDGESYHDVAEEAISLDEEKFHYCDDLNTEQSEKYTKISLMKLMDKQCNGKNELLHQKNINIHIPKSLKIKLLLTDAV